MQTLVDKADGSREDGRDADNPADLNVEGSEEVYDSDGSGSTATDSLGGAVEAAEYGAYEEIGNFLDIGINALAVDGGVALMVEHVFLSSTAARIRAYYEAMPETFLAVPVVTPVWASRPTRFNSPTQHAALRFALSAAGSGLTERDQMLYSETLRLGEHEAMSGTSSVGPHSATFPTPRSFMCAVRHEANLVLAVRRWQRVPINVGRNTYMYYFRDILRTGLDAVAAARDVSFGDPANISFVDLKGEEDDDARVRHGTLDADLYLGEMRDVRRLHGPDARVMGVQLHADAALVS